MPNYDYECEACKVTFQAFQSIKDDRLVDCPECKEPKLVRLIGTANLHFVGKEWTGRQIRREKEDKELFNRAKIARRLKTIGKIPEDAHVDAKDIDPDKYHGPAKLPKDHPERGTTAPIAGERGLE